MHLAKNNSNGFTLVEIALVLVVIGLLVGVTTTGQQLISTAQASRSVAQMQDVTAAYLTYLDRYRALPGDDAQAASRWPEAKNGNGDGRISGLHDALPPADAAALAVNATEGENLNFWWHLRLAGLISGGTAGDSPAAPIAHPLGGRAGVQQEAFGLRGTALCLSNVESRLASAVDARADDGRPDRGAIRGAPETGGAPPSVYPVSGEAYVLCVSVAGTSSGAAVALAPGSGYVGGESSGGAGAGSAPGGDGATSDGAAADGGTVADGSGTADGGGATDGGTTADAGSTSGGGTTDSDGSWDGGWGGRDRDGRHDGGGWGRGR